MKRQCTLEEIHAEIQRRIEASDWADGFCRDCTAPEPYRILTTASPTGPRRWLPSQGAKASCSTSLLRSEGSANCAPKRFQRPLSACWSGAAGAVGRKDGTRTNRSHLYPKMTMPPSTGPRGRGANRSLIDGQVTRYDPTGCSETSTRDRPPSSQRVHDPARASVAENARKVEQLKRARLRAQQAAELSSPS